MKRSFKLIFTENTALKAWYYQSKLLNDSGFQVLFKDEGSEIELEDYFLWNGSKGLGDDHICILTTEGDRYFVYAQHCTVAGTEEGNNPQDEPTPDPPVNILGKVPILNEIPAIKWGEQINKKIPGLSNKVRVKQPIFIKDSRFGTANFTWGEALHANPETGAARIPANASVTENIVKMAKVMQEIRIELGNQPITVNSWYRDPATNRRVGGASRSRHLSGDAVDFLVKGMSPPQVYAKLNPWWGARGGLASSSAFTHIDARGYKARWDYGY